MYPISKFILTSFIQNVNVGFYNKIAFSYYCKIAQNTKFMRYAGKVLTHFMPVISFYTPWKHQKTSGFLMFLGGIERDQLHEMG